MRTPFRTLTATALVGWMACNGKLLTIHVDDVAEATIEQGTLLEQFAQELGFGEFVTIDITDAEELQNQGVQPGDIQDVYLEVFELSAVGPEGADLSFLDEVVLYVEAPGLDKVRIAHQESFPPGQRTVSFTLDGVDLVDYAVSESMTFTTDASGRRPEVDTDIEATYDLSVGVTAQGACNQLKKK